MDKLTLIGRLCVAALLYLGLGTHAAQAAATVTAQHQLIASEQQGGGTSRLTFEIMLTNEGDVGLTGITLLPLDPHFLPRPGDDQTVAVESLPVGGMVSVVWTVTSPVSMDALLARMPIPFEGKGSDEAGNPVSFGVVSQGGASQ